MKLNKLLQLVRDNARAADTKTPSIRSEVEGEVAKVYVYDVIDSYWGANAAELVAALANVKDKEVELHINSPGGDVFEARAMSAAIAGHPMKVTAYIDGVAASAATYLALAANEVHMIDGGLFMVHNSWTFAYGNKTELRQTSDLLEKIDGTISADYQRKTGATAEQVAAWMDAETWFTAQEAMDAKFIDVIDANTKGEKAAAKWNLSAYANAPKQQPSGPSQAELNELAAAQLQRNQNRLRLMAQAEPN